MLGGPLEGRPRREALLAGGAAEGQDITQLHVAGGQGCWSCRK